MDFDKLASVKSRVIIIQLERLFCCGHVAVKANDFPDRLARIMLEPPLYQVKGDPLKFSPDVRIISVEFFKALLRRQFAFGLCL